MFLLSSSVSFGISCCLKLTAPDFSHGKILQEVAVWRKLERPPPHKPIWYILKRGAFAHNCHLHGTVFNIPHSPNPPKNSNKILFSHTWRWYHCLSLSFFINCCFYFMYCLFSILYIYYFYENSFNFSCSDMFPVPSFIDSPVSGQMGFVSL